MDAREEISSIRWAVAIWQFKHEALPARISTPGPGLVDLFDTSIVRMDKRWVRHQLTSKVSIDGR
jgi:hypothetical protein